MQSPRLYCTFLLWLLSELFEELPEVGDLDKPKLVFFFDEAHLLFDDAPKALLDKIEQVVRLIRSKGVGVYFVTQNPLDIPDSGAGPARQPRAARAARLHAAGPEGGEGRGRDLPAEPEVRRRRARSSSSASARRWSRSSTPRACRRRSSAASSPRRAAASARRPTPSAPPSIKASPLAGKYDQAVDRESAYEVLMGRAGWRPGAARGDARRRRRAAAASTMRRRTPTSGPSSGPWGSAPSRLRRTKRRSPSPSRACARRSRRQQPSSPVPKTPAAAAIRSTTTIIKSAARTATNIAVREASKAIFGSGRNAGILGSLVRGVLGGLQK